jgi:hypothetical protein
VALDADRLRALEHQAEALALQAAALRQQVTALVSEAEHGEVVAQASGAVQPAPQFYGGFNPQAPLKVETSSDASTQQKRTRSRP